MEFVIIGLLVAVFLICVSGSVFGINEKVLGTFFLLLGIVILVVIVFLVAPEVLPTGMPKTDISVGTYDVAFIYADGKNVAVGVRIVGEKEEKEKLYLYQFGQDAFEGEVVVNAKKLIVVKSGSFKKLKLE